MLESLGRLADSLGELSFGAISSTRVTRVAGQMPLAWHVCPVLPDGHDCLHRANDGGSQFAGS